jgi:hypothetical protein
MNRAPVSEVNRLKPKGKVTVPHQLKLSGNLENRGKMGGSGNKRPHMCGYKTRFLLESNPDYVLSWAGLIFGSGYVNSIDIVGSDLDQLRQPMKFRFIYGHGKDKLGRTGWLLRGNDTDY